MIRQDLHLAVGKDDGQEVCALAPARPRLANPNRSGTAMMAVCDVKNRNAGEFRFDSFNTPSVTDNPTAVSNSILGHEINCGSG
jgi:hypothetical protein